MKSEFVQTNGIRMHFLEEGSGPAVILLHGFPELGQRAHLVTPRPVLAIGWPATSKAGAARG
jgi:hypothetical protein